MSEQDLFTLRGRNPDVLSCIANLSNDEVFTPPELATRMLQTLADSWAEAHGGANIWADKSLKFIDPCAKSGIFLREITRYLTKGLTEEIPDLEQRVNHILTKQVFGIGITKLTSLLVRRSVYCSKDAMGKHSVANTFINNAGNIWFEPSEHIWNKGKCRMCGAPYALFEREKGLENHAYAFIHTDNIRARITELFGETMQFDVIIGNPPYQMAGGAGGSSDSSIYHLFVEQAIKLDPRLLSMVIPSRWLAGGRGMGSFRQAMLNSKHISHLVDYTRMATAFPGVDFEGGVGYFLWNRGHIGHCKYTLVQGTEQQPAVVRDLGAHDIFIRDQRALKILNKVRAHQESTMDSIVSGDTPFGLPTNFSDWKDRPFKDSVEVHLTSRGKRRVGYTSRSNIRKNQHLIQKWKVLIPEAYGERGAIPAMVLGPRLIAKPNSVCSQTYLAVGFFDTESQANSVQSYTDTALFRFLVSLRKITQHALRSTYSWVPVQSWDRTWTDEILFDKYGIKEEDIKFIYSMIRLKGGSDE